MKRIGRMTAAILWGIAALARGDGAPSLDIVGIKLGMPVKDAMQALKANNPRLTLTPATRELEGFAKPLLFAVAGQEPLTTAPDGTVARGSEQIEILFATAPAAEVWGVKRIYNFATREQPSLDNTLSALRKKYGPESVPASPDPRDTTKNMAWVYSTQGKSVGARGAQLNRACAGLFTAHFGGGDGSSMNEIQSGRSEPAECQSIIVVNATVLAGQSPSSSQLVVNGLIVQMTDGARHRASTEATRAVALRAVQAREAKEASEVQGRGAPKL